ncbi:hypothetical protein Tco_0837033 [Tanacetum coccineum]
MKMEEGETLEDDADASKVDGGGKEWEESVSFGFAYVVVVIALFHEYTDETCFPRSGYVRRKPVPFKEALAMKLDLFKPSLVRVHDFLEKSPPRPYHAVCSGSRLLTVSFHSLGASGNFTWWVEETETSIMCSMGTLIQEVEYPVVDVEKEIAMPYLKLTPTTVLWDFGMQKAVPLIKDQSVGISVKRPEKSFTPGSL